MPLLVVINNLLALKPVQYLLLLLTVALMATTLYLGFRVKWLAVEIKVIEAELTKVQGALELQNAAVKKAGEDQKKLEQQKQAKAKEAAQAKQTAKERAEEIMRLKMSKDCKEVTQWGIEQALSQSQW